jgi:hypothetical protein
LGLSACGDAIDPGMPAPSAMGGSESSKGDRSTDTRVDVDLPDVAGTYRFELESEAVFRSLEDGEETTVQTRVSALVDLTPAGTEVTWTFFACDVLLPEIDGRQPSVETAVIRDMAPVFVPSVWESGEQGSQLQTGTAVWVLGASLEDPATEELPIKADDPRLVDVDQDGQPGVSLHVGSFRLYASLRFSLDLSARYQADGSLQGEAGLLLETQLYGDDIPFYNAVKAVEEALAALELVDQTHHFRLIPVDPEFTDCDTPVPALNESVDRSEAEEGDATEGESTADEGTPENPPDPSEGGTDA